MFKIPKSLIIFCFVIITLAMLCSTMTVQAQGNWGTSKANLDTARGATGLPATTLTAFILNIIRYLLGGLGIIAVIMIMYGGFSYMTAGSGDPKKASKGKDIIKYAVIGLAIIILSLAITNFIFERIKAGASSTGSTPTIGQ